MTGSDRDLKDNGALDAGGGVPSSGSGAVKVGERYEIYPDQPLPQYNQGPVRAYAVGSSQSSQGGYALICERHLVPRHNSITSYSNIMNPNVAHLSFSGVVDWPLTKQQHFAFIYEVMPSVPLIARDQVLAGGLRQDQIIEPVMQPLLGILQDFRDKDFVHGCIRPSNIFKDGDGPVIERIVLGDCLALPASYAQPALFETVPRAMVAPIGRGLGTRADDMYAFGVTLAVLLRTSDPIKDASVDDIIRQKIEQGSYAMITGRDRFTGSVLELLRGLLHDDDTQRWTVDEVLRWSDGVRLSPKQSVRYIKAPRPISFNNEKYNNPVFLAMDLDVNPQETQRIVDSNEMEQWIERSLEDKDALQRYALAVKSSKENGTGAGYEDRLVSNLSIALDPNAPIRFRGLRLIADGIGKSLYEATCLKKPVRNFADMFLQSIALNWIGAQMSSSVDYGAFISRLDQCRKFVKLPKMGYGIERCCYLLSSETPCLSESLQDYYILSSEDFVLALEDLCLKGKEPIYFLDRHSTAFLSVREPKAIDSLLSDLDSNNKIKSVLASMKVLSFLQKRRSLPALPGIAKAFSKHLPDIYALYHDKNTQDALKKKVEPLLAKGDLQKIVDAVQDGNASKRDFVNFKAALSEYTELDQELSELKENLASPDRFDEKTGNQFAAFLSSILAIIVIVLVVFSFIRGDGGLGVEGF